MNVHGRSLASSNIIGLCGSCWHNFEHNRYAKASSIMSANFNFYTEKMK